VPDRTVLGVKREVMEGAGLDTVPGFTVNATWILRSLVKTMIVASVLVATGAVETLKVAEVLPAGMTTESGVHAAGE
jgi:hypothetical protein